MISEEEEMLAWRLRQSRQKAGITQEKAAMALGLDPTAIAKIEHGERGVSAMELVALAKAYSVSTNWLLFQEPEPEIAYQAMEAALQLLAGNINSLRTELLVIKAMIERQGMP